MKQTVSLLIFILVANQCYAFSVRLKDIARIEGEREVALVGYGIVVGLSGSGDSPRNKVTLQSLENTLERFGIEVDRKDLNAKNVAAVMITAELPPFSEPGDRIDIRVASVGDARSLSGGTLLLSPLYGPDRKLYVLAQGALTVGGYNIESFDSRIRKNHTTVGHIAGGGSVEQQAPDFKNSSGSLNVILDKPDYTTAFRVLTEIKNELDILEANIVHPGKISLLIANEKDLMSFVASLENIRVTPDLDARVVVNERTGTIVAGSNVTLGEVSIAHGSLRIEVETSYNVVQPQLLSRPGRGIETAIVPDTQIRATEQDSTPISLPAGTTVGDLVQALYKIKLSARDIISVLESIKAAGALHADLIIQ